MGNDPATVKARLALRITAEVTDWKGHPLEQIRAMNDHLERLKQQGIEAIEE